MEYIDRAAIFEELCCRNMVRREAGLPLLHVKAEYDLKIKLAEAQQLRALRQQYEPQVRAEVLSEMQKRYGPHWGKDLGGRYWLGALVTKVIKERYGI
jgi:hypothetical protein